MRRKQFEVLAALSVFSLAAIAAQHELSTLELLKNGRSISTLFELNTAQERAVAACSNTVLKRLTDPLVQVATVKEQLQSCRRHYADSLTMN